MISIVHITLLRAAAQGLYCFFLPGNGSIFTSFAERYITSFLKLISPFQSPLSPQWPRIPVPVELARGRRTPKDRPGATGSAGNLPRAAAGSLL